MAGRLTRPLPPASLDPPEAPPLPAPGLAQLARAIAMAAPAASVVKVFLDAMVIPPLTTNRQPFRTVAAPDMCG
ncbi:hypothetical protein GCM10011512_20390 [Tersicoccus solisilvae]|uniref:Uncharacterized protein n=1 Tax=Tersicoccus solisilvae TaxID=1882339 RepID=A0ABQ1PBJ1_9MICC|nr:hypothetical protein GCM10011512_20390 [Tersicoccus solisilvae]